jgi:hypothetical protein
VLAARLALLAAAGCGAADPADVSKQGDPPELLLGAPTDIGEALSESGALCGDGAIEWTFAAAGEVHGASFYGTASYVVSLTAQGDPSFDSVLALFGPAPAAGGGVGPLLASDDDGGDGLLSALSDVVLPSAGTYTVLVTSWAGNSRGSLTLRIITNGSPGCLASAPAPECVSNVDCNDDDACTLDTCAQGSCESAPNPACAPECAANGECNDGNPCTDDTCALGECVYVDNNAPCDDGDACTGSDQCVAGTCAPELLLLCDDQNPCTTDTCDPVQGCKTSVIEGPCKDSDPCSTSENCLDGVCTPMLIVSCVDFDPCTADACSEEGCVFEPIEGCVHPEPSCGAGTTPLCTLSGSGTSGVVGLPDGALVCDVGLASAGGELAAELEVEIGFSPTKLELIGFAVESCADGIPCTHEPVSNFVSPFWPRGGGGLPSGHLVQTAPVGGDVIDSTAEIWNATGGGTLLVTPPGAAEFPITTATWGPSGTSGDPRVLRLVFGRGAMLFEGESAVVCVANAEAMGTGGQPLAVKSDGSGLLRTASAGGAPCAANTDCHDGEECTADTCEDGGCVATPIDGCYAQAAACPSNHAAACLISSFAPQFGIESAGNVGLCTVRLAANQGSGQEPSLPRSFQASLAYDKAALEIVGVFARSCADGCEWEAVVQSPWLTPPQGALSTLPTGHAVSALPADLTAWATSAQISLLATNPQSLEATLSEAEWDNGQLSGNTELITFAFRPGPGFRASQAVPVCLSPQFLGARGSALPTTQLWDGLWVTSP